MARRWVRMGALSGIVTIFLALVGLIGELHRRVPDRRRDHVRRADARPPCRSSPVSWRPRLGSRVGSGTRCGVAEAAVAAAVAPARPPERRSPLAVVLADWIGDERIRAVFLNVTPQLMEFVTFGQPTVVGGLIIVVISAVGGRPGRAPAGGSRSIRRPVTAAVITTLLFGFLQRVIPIALDQLGLERDWLYSPQFDGLTWIGALVVAVVAAGISVPRRRPVRGLGVRGRSTSARRTRRDGDQPPPARGRCGRPRPVARRAAAPRIRDLRGPRHGDGVRARSASGSTSSSATRACWISATSSSSRSARTPSRCSPARPCNAFGIPPEPAISGSLNFYVAIPIVMVIAAAAGLLVGAPVLRLRGDYLALVTLGLGEIVTVLLASPWLVPLVGGPSGMRGITDAAIGGFGFRDPQHFYYLALAFVGLAAFVSWRLASSRIGRAWTAMREDEQTADAMGISTTRFKLLAFAIGGAIGSLGGALFAVKIGSLTPASFQVIVSIQVLGLVILGGIGSIPGVLVGALVLVGLPGLLREFEEYRFLAYGAADRRGDDPAAGRTGAERPPQPRAQGRGERARRMGESRRKRGTPRPRSPPRPGRRRERTGSGHGSGSDPGGARPREALRRPLRSLRAWTWRSGRARSCR